MPRPHRSALKVEHLEDRTVPAGDVTANILTDPDGFRTLYLQGDTADNRVTLRQLPTGVLQVHGISTTINGGKGVVSFANVHGLVASFSTGNDTVRTMNLRMQTVSLDGGFGDDDLAMLNTTLTDGIRAASLVVTGDPDVTVVPPDTLVNGRDKIDLAGTRISSGGGSFFPIVVYGDSIEDLDTPDDIRLTDTRLTFHGNGNHEVEIYGGFYGESRGTAGDAITVTDFRSETVGGGEFSGSGLNVYGSSGDDAIRLSGLDVTVIGTGGSNYCGPSVYGGSGFDRLDATDVTISATGPADSYQYFFPSFECEDVQFRDWDVAITSRLDESGGFILPPFQPGFYGVHNLELRDVRMTTPEGGGYIYIDSVDPVTGADGFATSILFDNVQIEQEVESPFGMPCLYESFSGSDTVRILNSRMPSFGVLKRGTDGSADVLIEGSELGGLGLTLGEGDYLAKATDTVRIRNTTIRDSAGILTFGGNDTIRVSDSMFGGRLNVQGGAGDDGITITGCTFTGSPEIRIFGDAGGFEAFYSAAGNDTIRVRNCILDAQDPDGVGVFASVLIGGDVVNEPGSTFVGGNDVIEVTDFTATVTSTANYTDLFFSVFGESVESGATLVGGHDEITLRNVNLHVTGVGPTSYASAELYVTGGAISGDSTLVGSNDTIRVRDVSVITDGATDPNVGFNFADVQIVGSEFYRDFFSDDLPTLVGGNDLIEVTNGYFRSSGGVFANFAGDFTYYDMSVTGGNDVITLANVATISGFAQTLSVSGEAGQLINSSGLDDTITMTNVSSVHILEDESEFGDAELYVYGGEGDNRMTLVNVTTGIVGTPLDSYEVMDVSAGSGNNVVSIRESSTGGQFFAYIGDGDDTLTITDSTFAITRISLGGGDDTAVISGLTTADLDLQGGAGDDELTVREANFTGSAVNVMIAGDYPNADFRSAAGNDTIRVIDSALRPDAGGGASLFIVGDNISYSEAGNTFVGGNDVIEIDGLTLAGGSSSDYYVSIIGDYVDAGTLVGGNDTITVRNLSADNTVPADFGYINLELYGDRVGAAEIVGGNDVIRLVDWTLDLGFSSLSMYFVIIGDYANGWDGTETEARAYIGGNDVIEVVNIHLSGSTLGPIFNFEIYGDYLIDRALVGGNDQITISDVTIPFDTFALSISCDEVVSQFFQSSIIGGNDTVSVTGLRQTLAYLMNGSGIGIGTDSYWEPGIYLDGGHDIVSINGCQIDECLIDTGGGDDELTVRDSTFTNLFADLGDGDDTAVIENNTATVSISVSGGAGWDMLLAWGNIASDLFFDDFEA